MKNTKYTFVLMAIMAFAFAGQAFAAVDCNIKNARVKANYRFDEMKTTYFEVGNLSKRIQIPVKDSELNNDLGKLLKSSDANKDVYLNLNLAPSICNQIIKGEDYQEFLVFPKDVKVTKASLSMAVDCVECTNLRNAPINIQLPSMKDMRNILDKSAGFTTENINLTSLMLVHLFERMNNKTPNANSLIFTVSLFRAFEALKVKTINKDQLQYLASRFQDSLPRDQFLLLKTILGKVDAISFNRNSNGSVAVNLSTTGAKTVTLTGKDIPVADPSARQMIEKYFNRVEIENNTSMIFADKKLSNEKQTRNVGLNNLEVQSFATPTTVSVQGIKVTGQFPVIGEIQVKPQELNVDIDRDATVKANVGFKKGILGLSYTFDLNN